MRVAFAAEARRRFLDTVQYIADHNPTAARQFRQRVWTLLRRLAKFPRLGPVIPEFPGTAYREVIHSPYRFFYRVEGERVLVVAVWQGPKSPTHRPGKAGRLLP